MDIYEELKKYKELLDEGIITQEEFEESKKKVLSKSDMLPLREHTSTSIENMEHNAEVSSNATGNSIGVVSENSEIIGESDSKENASSDSKTTNGKPKKKKIASIGMICLIAVVAIAIGVFLNSDVSKIQGSWDMAVIMADGKASAPIGPIGGSLNIKGNKWTMELHGNNTNTYTGTVKGSEKTTTNDGQEAIFYNLDRDGGKTLKAAYLPDNNAIMVCTSIIFDSDNGIIFKKKQ